MFLLILDTNNRVSGCIESDGNNIPGGMIKRDVVDYSLVGKIYHSDTQTFSDLPDTNSYLTITAPTQPISKSTDITVHVSVKDAAGNFVNVTSTYYVPVISLTDKKQAAFLTINFSNGQAMTIFQIADAGIYSMDFQHIRPVPTAILQSNIGFIVL